MTRQALSARFGAVLISIVLSATVLSAQRRISVITPAPSLSESTPWDLQALSEPPEFEWLDPAGQVRAVKYSGPVYQGHRTQVFAYYGCPTVPEGSTRKFPAMVLVHGGGGKAFDNWVKLWVDRGYAAIAMDLAGCGRDGKRMDNGGPGQSHTEKFATISEPVENQWSYHAVANVIRAHSLILSFEEVDPDRTAVTGISWGGYLTCIVAGLDNRFKAAVPVYGCGFLDENSCWLGEFAAITEANKQKWVRLWDPSKYVGSAAMPVFFMNGTNDFAYPLDSYARTYSLVTGPRNIRITVNMPHSHPDGWAPQEIGMFVDQYLAGGKPLAVISRPVVDGESVKCSVQSGGPVVAAQLHYTTGTEAINKRTWTTVEARVEGSTISAVKPPGNAGIYFFTARDERGATVSSELVFAD